MRLGRKQSLRDDLKKALHTFTAQTLMMTNLANFMKNLLYSYDVIFLSLLTCLSKIFSKLRSTERFRKILWLQTSHLILSNPLLSGHPLLGGQSRKYRYLAATSIKRPRPPFSRTDEGFAYCFYPYLAANKNIRLKVWLSLQPVLDS